MLDESQAEIKITRKNINNLRYADDTTLMGEVKEETTSLFTQETSLWQSEIICTKDLEKKMHNPFL